MAFRAKKNHLLLAIITCASLITCSCDSVKKGVTDVASRSYEEIKKANPFSKSTGRGGDQPFSDLEGPIIETSGGKTRINIHRFVGQLAFRTIEDYRSRKATRREVAKAEESVEKKEPTQIEEEAIETKDAKYAEKIGEKNGKVEVVIVDPKTNRSVDNKVYEIPKEEIEKLEQAPPDKPQVEDQIPTQSKTDTKPIEPVPPEQPPVTPPTTSEVKEPQPTAPDESDQPVVAKEDTETTGTEEGPKQERVKFGKLGSHNVIFRL